jgi:trigger factor
MHVAIPAERLEKAVVERLQRLSKTAKLPGFRPGKVPMKVIEAKFGGQVMQEVAGELINSSFHEAVGQEGLRPAGGATFTPKTLNRGQDVEYEATFEVFPQVARLDIAGMRIDRPVCEVTDEDVDRTLETMQRQRLQWLAVDRPAAEGDRVTMDFTGTLDGEVFDGGSAKDYDLVLGSGSLVKGFEEQLVGASAGDKRDVEVEFPADYGSPKLAGRKASFAVEVKAVQASQLPEIDGEFAKSFGIEDGDVQRLKAEVRENLQRELGDRIRARLRDQVMEALLEVNDIDIPRPLLDEEIQRLIQANRETLKRYGASPDLAPTDPEAYEANARRRVALGLILSEVAAARQISPDKDRVREILERTASSYEDPEEFVKWHFADPRRLADVQAVAMEEMIVEKLLEEADIKDAPVSFVELMQDERQTPDATGNQ